MSGHSKWANIKHKKEATDKKRGKVFSKIAKMISVAVKLSGPDPEANPTLRTALEKAREANMPKENIDRAIEKYGGKNKDAFSDVLLEIIGKNGVNIILMAKTDNKNRILTDVKQVLVKQYLSLADAGSVMWNFEKRGVIEIASTKNQEEIELDAIDNGALDVALEKDGVKIFTRPEQLIEIQKLLSEKYPIANFELSYLAKNPITLDGEERAKMRKSIDALEALDDVENVWINLEI